MKRNQFGLSLSRREKQVLAGLYLSRFDKDGLHALNFSSFTEAFNVIGFALGARPASIKNYRDEFDPIYSVKRMGWHKREMRDYCKRLNDEYGALSFAEFTKLLKVLIYKNGSLDLLSEEYDSGDDAGSFSKRLITGQSAEKYFEIMLPAIPLFAGYVLENVTGLGCGFDFRLCKPHDDRFLAIEVKGLYEDRGSVSLTSKEFRVADRLSERFFLFVVKNFKEKPFHEYYCDPLRSNLTFKRREQNIMRVDWFASV